MNAIKSQRSESFRRIASATLGALSIAFAAAAETQPAEIAYSARTHSPDQLIVTVSAPPSKSQAPTPFRLPAGQIYVTATGDRIATLREASAELQPNGNAELTIPCATLSLHTGPTADQPVRPTAESEPKLAPLLSYLAPRNDVPRATSACAAQALLHDITFQQWLEMAPPAPSPAEAAAPSPAVVQAIDAIGILRQIAPERTFLLASDPQLKLRALRNPVTRAKALQLYGMTIPGDTAAAGQTPPDLGQLLHTKPGDNCPICRMRAQMQAPASDL